MKGSVASPRSMSAVGGEKRHHRCLGCCIACLVIIVLFVGLVIGGSAIAFNKFVSPMIGGVKFGAVIRLLSGVYNGESNRDKIVTNAYTEEDLSDFYTELNAHLFQKKRSANELKEEFAALSEEERTNVLAELQANGKWNAIYQKADNQEEVLESYYVAAGTYPITIAKVLAAVNLQEMAQSATAEQQQALDAFLSTEPEARLAAAGDSEETVEGEDANGEGEDDANLLTNLFKELHFDFTEGGLLGQFDHTQAEDYAANIESVTFEITGKQIAAVAGEIVSQVLSNVNLASVAGAESAGFDLSGIYLPDYILIPQVVIEHKSRLYSNATPAEQEEYKKDTYMSLTLEMRFRDLLNNQSLRDAIKASLADMVPTTALVDVGFAVIKSILPKTLFVTAGIYPLDSSREIFIKINNYSEQSQKDLATIINALAGQTQIFDEDSVGKENADTPSVGIMQQINGMVVDVFSKIDQSGIPLSFVDYSDGKSVGLRLAHVQMLLSMMNAYDPTGENGITPYQFMTVLKCLFSNPSMVVPTEGDLDALYQEIQDKYGIAASFWQNGGMLNVSNLQNLPGAIDIKDIELRDNTTMRVKLQDRQLLSLFVRAKEDGTLSDFLGGDSTENTAAAGDSDGTEENTSSVNNLITSLNMSKMDIRQQGSDTLYSLSMRATLSVVNLLGDALKDDNSMLQILTDALPNSLSFGITLYIHTDADGNFVSVGASEDGQNKTSFLINAFDEGYSLRVIQAVSTLLRCLGAGEGLDTDSLIEKVDSAFNSIFTKIKDYLYCDVGVKNGALVLPSLYEVVRGFSMRKVEQSDSLTEADLLTTEEIRDVLQTMYHSTYQPTPYEGTPGDAMLTDLQSKYYLASSWSAADLFGSNVNIGDKINADSINFRDPVDQEGHPVRDTNGQVVHGLYHDTLRSLDDLRVNIAGDALADLLTQSGKLDSLTGEGESGMLKGLEVINCTYTVEDGCTWANFNFLAKLIEEQSAQSEDSQETSADGFDLNTVMPESIYLTAKILLHRDDGDYTDTKRYDTQLIVNNRAAATDNMFKLVKVFSGEEFDRSKVSDQVSDSVSDAFVQIEDSVNLVYGDTVADALQLDNIFNTINKLSNKPTEEEAAAEGYTPYVSDVTDDQALRDRLLEFGRDPASTMATVDLVHTSNAGQTQNVYASVAVDNYHDVFGVSPANYIHTAPTKDDQAYFFDTLNQNYYISDGKELTISEVKSGSLVVDDTLISLAKLYRDTRSYDQLTTYAYDKQIASIIDAMYADGIEVKSGTDLMGTARIIAVHIESLYMQAFIRVEIDPNYANARMLPEVLYLTSCTYLQKPFDNYGYPLLDENGNEREAYYTTVCINNMTYDDTLDLFDRMDKLASGMQLNFSIKMDDITAPVETNIKDVFEDKLSRLGNVKYNDGNLEIPSLFAYLADGKLVKDSGDSVYDKTKFMVDIDLDKYIADNGLADEAAFYALPEAITYKTEGETLMYRMRELGKADADDTLADNMYIWVNNQPVDSGDRYNSNTFLAADEQDFFDQLKALYFFAESINPTAEWFQEGHENIFSDLNKVDENTNKPKSLDSTFNLTGYAAGYSSALLNNYAAKGLYNYDGTQYGVKLSDKAMASLMNSIPNAMSISADNIDSIEVTSVEIHWDVTNPDLLSVQITVDVTTTPSADPDHPSALPSHFYMTTYTTRDATDANNPTYQTKMTINRFALDSDFDTKDGDLHKLLFNLSHIDTLNIKDQLDEQTICDNVSEALRKMLDEKLKPYIQGFGSYGSALEGVGYIQFNSIYHEIINRLNVDRTQFANADNDIQQVLVKLHNNQDANSLDKAYVSYNTKSPSDHWTTQGMGGGIIKVSLNDRGFANILEAEFQNDNERKDYVSNTDAIFFVNHSGANPPDYFADNPLFETWETLISASTANDDFRMVNQNIYILTTITVDLTAANVSSDVSILPDTVYVTLLTLYGNTTTVLTSFINDFNYEEMQLSLSFMQNTGKIDFTDTINNFISNTFATNNLEFVRNSDTNFTDYVGEGSYYTIVP